MAKPNSPRSPRQFPGPGELERMVCDAINVADNDGTVAQLWDRAHREPEIDEQKLWERPILKHIYTASLNRQMDPRGVLAVKLARAICSISPYVTPSACNMNLRGLVGSSGAAEAEATTGHGWRCTSASIEILSSLTAAVAVAVAVKSWS